MHPAIIIGRVRSLIVDVAMGQIPRSTERISSCQSNATPHQQRTICGDADEFWHNWNKKYTKFRLLYSVQT